MSATLLQTYAVGLGSRGDEPLKAKLRSLWRSVTWEFRSASITMYKAKRKLRINPMREQEPGDVRGFKGEEPSAVSGFKEKEPVL